MLSPDSRACHAPFKAKCPFRRAVWGGAWTGICCRPGVRLPGCFEPFEMAVRDAGSTDHGEGGGHSAGRLAVAFGAPVETGLKGLSRTFPSAHAIAALPGDIADRLGLLGITWTWAGTMKALGRVHAMPFCPPAASDFACPFSRVP